MLNLKYLIMRYNLIIALDGDGNRNVGQIISVCEKKGLELIEIKKKEAHHSCRDSLDLGQFILLGKLQELEAMNFYREKFDPVTLNKKIKHFYKNHVELSFDAGEKIIDSNNLWEVIAEQSFDNGKNLPIMFFVAMSDENGLDNSFVPNDFEPNYHYYFNPRTAIPLGK